MPPSRAGRGHRWAMPRWRSTNALSQQVKPAPISPASSSGCAPGLETAILHQLRAGTFFRHAVAGIAQLADLERQAAAADAAIELAAKFLQQIDPPVQFRAPCRR